MDVLVTGFMFGISCTFLFSFDCANFPKLLRKYKYNMYIYKKKSIFTLSI